MFGVGRALVLAGAFFLVFNRITPADLSPKWITGGFTWPLARKSADLLTVFAPGGMKLANGVTKMMGEGVQRGFNESDDQGVELGGSEPANTTGESATTPSSSNTTSTTRRHRAERTGR